MPKHLPTRSDFVVSGSLDEESASRHMLGKSMEEVRALLDDNFIYYQEDFMWMGPRAFCYYVSALVEYIKCEIGEIIDRPAKNRLEEIDVAASLNEISTFCTLCDFRVETKGEWAELGPCADKIVDTLDWLISRVNDEYPDLASRARQTRTSWQQLLDG